MLTTQKIHKSFSNYIFSLLYEASECVSFLIFTLYYHFGWHILSSLAIQQPGSHKYRKRKENEINLHVYTYLPKVPIYAHSHTYKLNRGGKQELKQTTSICI